MGTKLSSPPTIKAIQMVELKVALTPPMPQCMAKIALLDEDGLQVAESVFTAFGGETWQKMKELEMAIEKDYLGVLEGGSSIEDPEVEEENDYELSEGMRWSRTS